MVFKCQADSYLTNFSTTVVACEPVECKVPNDIGVMVKLKGFNVELEDTILFPEGGGQPDDRGMINRVAVRKVARKGAKALHFVEHKLAVGESVDIEIDWDRRFDHMQQHSAQHLITAITDNEYGFKTTSWDLGREFSFIELDTNEFKPDALKHIENLVNQAIRDRTPVIVHVTHVGSPLLHSVRTRGLPDDHVGDVRIVEIKGIEANMCCGTHVRNLTDLQCVKLLGVERGKKGKSNLYFIAGSRVLHYTGKSYAAEKGLTKQLKCGADQHVAAVERSLKQLKVAQKNCTNLLRDVALLEAQRIKSEISNDAQRKRFYHIHRREGNVEFMNIIANEIGDQVYLFLTTGDEKGAGMFVLTGPGTFAEDCAPKITDLITGKGAVKAGRMQGKAEKLQKKDQAVDILLSYVNNL